jgi:tetratricopeptide (TPR) repeat protein/transcriptional regulator with XRE-family HTH domain
VGADQAGPRGRFGGMLRQHRLAAGLTQEELAERSGLTARAVANLERGRTTRPYRHSVRALADALALAEPERLLLERASRPQPPEPSERASPSTRLLPRDRPEIAERRRVVPRQLPASVSCFTGRVAELAALTRLLDPRPGEQVPTMVISAIAGTAGVGKTALAVRWAHLVADRFPDGQLYVNLRGYDPADPVESPDALASFLRALGVPGREIPDEPEDRSRLYRSRLAGQRMLVLLDNARDSDQIRPLLPGEPGCMAVVTSRDSLAGLVAADGARLLDLDVLPRADAVALLRSLIGPRADADPRAVSALAGVCARLPLALRIAAQLAATRRSTPLAGLVAELEAGRLQGLDAGDHRADVRSVFSWSLRQLPDDVARAFALAGLHPGEEFEVFAVAALTASSTARVGKLLGRLHRANLLQAAGTGRYGMHDLLRVYARERAVAAEHQDAFEHTAGDTGDRCHQALTRLFDYYVATAVAAMELLFPGVSVHTRIRPTAALVPAMRGQAEARAWLDAERANLVAVVVHCARRGWPDHAADLARTLFRDLITGSHLPEALTVYRHALHAARQSGDPAAEAVALNGLGTIAGSKGRFLDATAYFEAALERYRQCGNRGGEAGVLHNLGVAEHQLHNYEPAAGYYRQAIAAFGDTGNQLNAAAALCSLAGVEAELGSCDLASEHLQSALQVFRGKRDDIREAEALSRIGELDLLRGRLDQAATSFEQSLAIFRLADRRTGVADELFNLGTVSLRQDDYQRAIGYFRQALDLFRETENQHGEAYTRRSIAEALHGCGQPAAARRELEKALRLATDTGHVHEQARAHSDLAQSYHAAGDDERARLHWQLGLDLYIELGAPEAQQIRMRLSTHEATAQR